MNKQNLIASMLYQFDHLLYPALNDRYTFRGGHNRGCWYLTCKRTGSVYSLIYDGEPPDWRVRSVTGLTLVQQELEAEVKRLCTANQ